MSYALQTSPNVYCYCSRNTSRRYQGGFFFVFSTPYPSPPSPTRHFFFFPILYRDYFIRYCCRARNRDKGKYKNNKNINHNVRRNNVLLRYVTVLLCTPTTPAIVETIYRLLATLREFSREKTAGPFITCCAETANKI